MTSSSAVRARDAHSTQPRSWTRRPPAESSPGRSSLNLKTARV